MQLELLPLHLQRSILFPKLVSGDLLVVELRLQLLQLLVLRLQARVGRLQVDVFGLERLLETASELLTLRPFGVYL